jgi:outer membrane receptor for ferrienterochelin and colicin
VRTALLVALPLLAASAPIAAQQDTTVRAPTAVEDLVVTVERAPTRASDASAPVRTVSRAELERRAAGDLTTVLRDVPGVQVDPVVSSGAGITLQGLGSDRVLILLDGAPISGRIGGEFDLTRISPSQIERIEIVEGPQSTLYGSSAIGGVVNLLTRRDLAHGAELSTQVGSDGQRDARARASGGTGGVNGSLDVGRRSVDLAPGRASGATGTADRWDAMARASTRLGTGTLDARVLGIQEEQQYLTTSRSGVTTGNFNDNWQLDGLVSATLDRDGRTELRFHGSYYDHRFVPSATTERSGGVEEWDRQRTADVEALRRGAFGAHRWLAGAKVEREWLTSDRVVGGSRAAWTGAAYATADWAVASWLRTTTGVRLTSGEVWGTDVAPRVGIVAHGPAATYLKLGGARGFRAPSFKELYTSFTNTRGATYTVLGDPDLQPEYSWNASAEIGRTTGGTEVYARAFQNWLRNFIETELVDPSASVFQYQNVARARTAGLEVGGSLTRGIVTARASHAYLETEDESTGEPLLGRAAHMTRGGVTLQPGRVSVTGEVVHTTSTPLSRSAAGTTYQGAYTRMNISAGLSLSNGARFTVGVDNVADSEPEGAATDLGRRWFGGMSWGFGW